jgi:hypothetical protein
MVIAIKLGCEGSLGILPESLKRKRKLFALLYGDGVELNRYYDPPIQFRVPICTKSLKLQYWCSFRGFFYIVIQFFKITKKFTVKKQMYIANRILLLQRKGGKMKKTPATAIASVINIKGGTL